jgi:hypothetical protein
MKVFSLTVLQVVDGTATTLTSASDLSTFSFYQRGSVGEFMGFMAKTVAERTAAGQRQSVQENSYIAHVYNPGLTENLTGKIEFLQYVFCLHSPAWRTANTGVVHRIISIANSHPLSALNSCYDYR